MKRRKKMCATCIYRTGELERNIAEHCCHEHLIHDGEGLDFVLCAGSCRPEGYNLVNYPTPGSDTWLKVGSEAIPLAIERLLERGKGRNKMQPATRHLVFAKKLSKINL